MAIYWTGKIACLIFFNKAIQTRSGKWNERYLTRAHLLPRVELRLERGCFESSAWQDTFYRDLRIVKQAFEAAGYRLLYSRNKQQPGYYLDEQAALSAEIASVEKQRG